MNQLQLNLPIPKGTNMAKAATAVSGKPDFGSILDRQGSEIERPKPLPQGSYLCVVKGLPRHDKSAKKQTPYVEYTLQPLQALDDVDAEALAEIGGLENKTIKATFYLTEASAFMLKDFLAHCGVDVEGQTLRAAIEEAPNCQVIAHMKHEASEDGERVYSKLAKTAPVE